MSNARKELTKDYKSDPIRASASSSTATATHVAGASSAAAASAVSSSLSKDGSRSSSRNPSPAYFALPRREMFAVKAVTYPNENPQEGVLLPGDVLSVNVYPFLDPRSLTQVMATCRKYHNLANDVDHRSRLFQAIESMKRKKRSSMAVSGFNQEDIPPLPMLSIPPALVGARPLQRYEFKREGSVRQADGVMSLLFAPFLGVQPAHDDEQDVEMTLSMI